jgi:hypothetical protein
MKLRGIVILACLVGAFVAATCKLASAQAPGSIVNPSFIEFGSADHSSVIHYKVCFYPSATATTAFRCNDVPVSAATQVSAGVYRIPRSAWSIGLTARTDYWPKVAAVGSTLASAEVAPVTAPFSFRLDPAPAAPTTVTLVP